MFRKKYFIEDYVWKKFWYLTILEEVDPEISKYKFKTRQVKCICDCWKIDYYVFFSVIRGQTTSCWCKRWRHARTHWMSKDLFYHRYNSLNERCNNEKCRWYKNYWGRWIKNLWKSFENFKDDMYESYSHHIKEYGKEQTSLDRIDNNWNYCKENCRRATRKEQCNNRRSSRYITYKWETHTREQRVNILWLDKERNI
jgi:hypothetical protein